MFPGLPRFSLSSASVYYTERKLKNIKWGRPGNEANWVYNCFISISLQLFNIQPSWATPLGTCPVLLSIGHGSVEGKLVTLPDERFSTFLSYDLHDIVIASCSAVILFRTCSRE